MNVFVLCTGRCGSTTLAEACRHMSNYTSAHESRSGLMGTERLAYPDNHIEADNRLSWYLGRLDEVFGDRAFYVHLMRDRERVAESYARRERGLMRAFRQDILMPPYKYGATNVAYEVCDMMTENIRLFLRDKTKKMEFHLESAAGDFERFWNAIAAEGDFESAVATWDRKMNSSVENEAALSSVKRASLPVRALRKSRRILREAPAFIREV